MKWSCNKALPFFLSNGRYHCAVCPGTSLFISDSSIIYFVPPKCLWFPPNLAVLPSRYSPKLQMQILTGAGCRAASCREVLYLIPLPVDLWITILHWQFLACVILVMPSRAYPSSFHVKTLHWLRCLPKERNHVCLIMWFKIFLLKKGVFSLLLWAEGVAEFSVQSSLLETLSQYRQSYSSFG